MITIEIDGSRRRLEEGSEPWIRQDINRRVLENGRVCALVTIVQPPDVDFILPTADCPRSGGARELTRRENALWERWKRLGLNAADYPKGKLAGTLWAFLQQAK
jgi:hypothetical protein